MDRYGDALEFDLAQMNLDLIDFFRGRHSWRKLANMLARLPLSSAYWDAQANDEDYAAFILSLPEQPAAEARPTLVEFTPEVARLTDISDQLSFIITLIYQLAGGKPKKPTLSARPRTAIDELRERKRGQRHTELLGEVEQAQARWEQAHNS